MGKQWKQCLILFFWAPKSLQMVIAAMKLKKLLLLGRKVMTNLDSIFKSRDITLPTQVHLVKAMVFPVVMYGCESWTVKKAEHWRIDAFELCFWRRLLRVPWTARRSNQSIPNEISPGCSLEGLMLKVKLQYFGHLMWRVDSLEKILMLGKVGGRRRRLRYALKRTVKKQCYKLSIINKHLFSYLKDKKKERKKWKGKPQTGDSINKTCIW